ncbi:MAG: hypothetical protein M1821_001185 [Bathelium mastoideum]|nr:MAG: hypothetical protein M1821_001185 [Bathelium mastoideum]
MPKLLVDYQSSYIRLFFRILFFVLFIAIGFLGKLCLSTRAKLKLTRRQPVPLPLMSSWLSSFDSILALKTIRTLPGGWLGVVMIIAYLLNLGADFASAFIQTITVHDRCEFGTGLVISDTSMQLVPWNGAPYAVATSAQSRGLTNGGLKGVYAKINRDSRFSADASDVLGTWTGTMNPLQLHYPYYTSSDDIIDDLVQHELLYSTPVYVASGDTSHLVVLDSSAGETTGTSFDVRVSVDVTALGNETKQMQSYECALDDSSGWLHDVQSGISSLVTLQDWKQTFQGSLYNGTGTPASPACGNILEGILNSMTMVAGGANYLLNTTASTETQGCITMRTWILWELLVLAGAVILLAAFLAFYWIGMLIHLKVVSKRMDRMDVKWIDRYTPGDTFEWMAQAVRERGLEFSTNVVAKDVSKFYFGKSKGAGGYGVISSPETSDQDSEGANALLGMRGTGSV